MFASNSRKLPSSSIMPSSGGSDWDVEPRRALTPDSTFRGAERMAMTFYGNVCGKVRVNFLAMFASKPRIFMCGALKLFVQMFD